ncbi:MAG: hypothetical protein OEN55_01470 [Alphaproteobacteria bacterium]|nr:hypothetical protein [Alphaproteobacteria bacterium]
MNEQKNELQILLQAYGPEAALNRYYPRGNEVSFELRHGDTMPQDACRTDGKFDRIELSTKPAKKDKDYEETPLKWRKGGGDWSYDVAAPWRERKVGKGHIILGQLHCGDPIFSLRWEPNEPESKRRLWMDFITKVKGDSCRKARKYIGCLIEKLDNGCSIRIKIKATAENSKLNLTANASSLDQHKEIVSSNLIECHPGCLTNDKEPLRFKFGAYRRRKDQREWASMMFTYNNIKIGGEELKSDILICPAYNDGF